MNYTGQDVESFIERYRIPKAFWAGEFFVDVASMHLILARLAAEKKAAVGGQDITPPFVESFVAGLRYRYFDTMSAATSFLVFLRDAEIRTDYR